MTNGFALRSILVLATLLVTAPLWAQPPAIETEPPATEDAPTPTIETEPPLFEAPQQDSFSESIHQLLGGLWAPQDRYTNGPHVRKAFRSVIARVGEATVEVRARGRRIAYGGIVGPDGWIVTKASQVRGPVTCRLRDGRELDAQLVGVDSDADLAMLKVDAKNLPTLNLTGTASAEETQIVAIKPDRDEAEAGAAPRTAPSAEVASELQPGDWLATVGLSQSPISVGVVSVLPRTIEKSPGFLGVQIDLQYAATEGTTPGVRIENVTKDGAADEAGLLGGDLITAVDNMPTTTPQELKAAISGRNPGDRVELAIQRDEEKMRLIAILRGWAPNPAQQRAYYQNHLGGDLSERRFGFPSALQHDTVLTPDECGGPVVDLDGRVVAFNIARAGRTESYALPVAEVRSRLFDLMSGRLAPVDAAD